MNSPKLTSIDHLFDWFIDGGKPYFVLFAGHLHSKSRSKVITENHRDIGIEDAWNMLLRNIQNQVDGSAQFTIYAPDKPKGSQGKTTYLELRNDPATSINGFTAGQHSVLPQNPLAGIGQVLPGGIPAYISDTVQKENTIAKLEMQLERKEEKIEELLERLAEREYDTVTETLVGAIAQDPSQAIDGLVKIISLFKGSNPTQLDYNKVAGQVPVQEEEDQEVGDNLNGDISQEEYKQRLAVSSSRISEKMDLLVLLENVAELLDYNISIVELLSDMEVLKKLSDNKEKLIAFANMA